MSPPSGRGMVFVGLAFSIVFSFMAGIPNEDDGSVRRSRANLYTEVAGLVDRSSAQSVPQGILDQGLNHEGRNLLGPHPFWNGQQSPIHRAVHSPEFEPDVISEHGPFSVERQPPASAGLNLVYSQATEGPQVFQPCGRIPAEKVMHDAVESIEKEMRIHEVAQGIRLDPGQLSALHQGLLSHPALCANPGMPMGHFRMTAPLFAAKVFPDRTVEQKSMAG